MIHPETGEVLDSREDFQEARNDVERRLGYLYNLRQSLRDGWVERFETAEQPAPRYRTQTQDKVARCPRCGQRLEEKDASNDSPR